MVQALALVYDFSTSKHSTLKGWFNKEFVFKKILASNIYKIYNRAFDKRQEGDYDDFVKFEKEEVEEDFEKMKKTLEEIEAFIESKI